MVDVDSNDAAEKTEKFRIEIVQKCFGASSEQHGDDVDLGYFIEAYEELNNSCNLCFTTKTYKCKYFSALEFICAFISALATSTNEDSVSSICRKTYEDTLARFHPWVIRKAVGLASYTLPSRGQLITSIQGNMPEESYVREVLSDVVAKIQVVHSRVDAIFTQYELHTLL
ncbi:glycolipid transfer protein [Ancylostoma caninum]|uniref:Glycolipid transfer protein n=1 Tax=Ancylostoma caninum TaxID=29170 RepID=A0A368F7I5_ANCCA|nr:glycolipid transfer protein [Ancylostoma caninum]